MWLPEVMALVCDLVKQVLGVTPGGTRVPAGLALYSGFIAETGSGEGKMLTAPIAATAHSALHWPRSVCARPTSTSPTRSCRGSLLMRFAR